MRDEIEDKLVIVIITYNRCKLLSETLESLLDSPFKDCSIKILNNCSTDDTLAVCERYKKLYFNMEVITNKFNIGGDANILRACEVADKEYLWILADDDQYDFSEYQDVVDCICEGNIDLIHVGAHTHIEWSYGGTAGRVKDLVNKGYSFFLFSSFIPCSIFKVETAYPYIVEGYKNIVNSYAHMPYLLSYYIENKTIYISKRRLVKAIAGYQDYSHYTFIKGWLNTSYLLKNKSEVCKCFFEQFIYLSKAEIFYTFLFRTILRNYLSRDIMYKIWQTFNFKEKINCIAYLIPFLFKRLKESGFKLA